MESVIKAILVGVITTAVMFAEAQVIVWGLSLYHVNSGIWPVWLIGLGVEGILSTGVATGIRSVKNER